MVKKEYKETEIGTLPVDWEVIDFEDCFELLPNNTLSRAELNYDFGEVRNVHYGDILVEIPSILDCSEYELPFVNTNNIIKNPRSFLKNGDIIIADTAEDETVGKATEVYKIETKKVVSGLHTIACRPRVEFEPKWLGYFINHRMYHDQLLPYITGTKVSAISKGSIKLTKVVKPLPEEQTAIVEAVDDINQLINSLERLIRKKKAIKKGVMQELLTGNKRLPEFSGEWVDKKLKDVYTVLTTGKLDANAMSETGIYRFYTCAKSYYFIDSYAFDDEALLISGNGENVGYIHYYKGKFNAYQRTYILMGFTEDIFYIKYYLEKYLPERIEKEVHAGGTPYIKKDTISEMTIKLPSTIEEQKAISQILLNMDVEIELLQEKLNKYQKIKQDMLDELLTGKTRLI